MAQLEEKAEAYRAKELEAMNEMAIELAVAPSTTDIYKIICEKLKKITGALLTGVTSYDSQKQELRVEHICADSKLITKASGILGRKVKELRIPLEPHLPEWMVSEKAAKIEGLHELMFGTVPRTVTNALEKAMGIGGVYGLALHYGGEFMGTMTVLMPKQQPLLSLEMLKTFANLAATSIQRKKAEDALERVHSELELQVQERTAELEKSAEALKAEITERKKSEEALRESKEKLSSLLENIPVVPYRSLPDKYASTVYVSRDIKSVLGFSKEEWLADPKLWLKQLHPEDRKRVLAGVSKTIKTRAPYDMEYRLFTKNGELKWFSDKASLVTDGKGKPLYLAGVIIDIAERKKSEEALRESEERLRSFFDNANDLIQSVDAEGRFVYVNKRWRNTLGYSEDEAGRLKLTDILRKDQIPHCMELFKRVCSGESLENIETVFIAKNGREINVEGSANAHFKDGKFAATLGIFRDITERKKMENEREVLLHTIGERVKELNCLYSLSKLVERPNISLDEILQGSIKLIPDALQYPEIMCVRVLMEDKEYKTDNFKKTKWRYSTDIRVHGRKVGAVEVYYLKDRLVGYRGVFSKEDINLITAIAEHLGRNIERKRAEYALKSSYEKLKKLYLLKDKFMNIASHELKTPLVPIIGYTSMMLDDEDISGEQRDHLDIILKAAKREEKLADDILDITQLESDAMKFTMSDVDLSVLAERTVQDLQSLADKKKVTLKAKIQGEIPKVRGDRYRLDQVLANLVDNAVKFTEKGSVTVEVKKDKNYVLVSVRDTGIGVSRKDMPNLFSRFFQVEKSFMRRHGGSGLGLAICRGIVEAHDGGIWVESEYGSGSVFTFSIPIERVLRFNA